jgi:hypothetical protein
VAPADVFRPAVICKKAVLPLDFRTKAKRYDCNGPEARQFSAGTTLIGAQLVRPDIRLSSIRPDAPSF